MSAALRRALGAPLLAKELTESASRPRTYVLRLVFGAVMLVLLTTTYRDLSDREGTTLAMLGRSAELFEPLVLALFGAIYLLVPATCSGAIADERRRGSLELLLLTDIAPLSILLQKYIARLVPVLSCLLLALPLLAASLALGGVEPALVTWSALLLLATALQVGAIAFACSAFSQQSGAATALTYAALIALYLGGSAVVGLQELLPPDALIPPSAFQVAIAQGGPTVDLFLKPAVGVALIMTIPLLLLARLWMTRRLRARSRNPLLAVFRFADAALTALNDALFAGATLRAAEGIDEREPIRWLEEHRRALGRSNYAIRALLAAELLTVGACVSIISGVDGRDAERWLQALWLMAWALSTIGMLSAGVSLIPSERAAGTLDLLLVTPLGAGEVIRQKAAGLWRLGVILTVPLLTVSLVRAAALPGAPHHIAWRVAAEVALTGLLATINLPLVAYAGVLVGVLVQQRLRATLLALFGLAAVVVVPVWFVQVAGFGEPLASYLRVLSPATLPLRHGAGLLALDAPEQPELVAVVLLGHCLLWGFVAWLLASLAHHDADELLGRSV